MSKIEGWFPITKRPVALIVRSRMFRFAEHFYQDPLGSARCQGLGCVLCESSTPRPISCCVVSKFGSDRKFLLKITEKLQPFADQLDARGPQLIGTIVTACRDKKGDFWLTEMSVTGFESTSPVMVQSYISQIGEKSYAMRAAMLQKPAARLLELPL